MLLLLHFQIYVYLHSFEKGGYVYKVVTWWMKYWDSGFDITVLDIFAFIFYLLGFGIDLTLVLTLCGLPPGWGYSLIEKNKFSSIVAVQAGQAVHFEKLFLLVVPEMVDCITELREVFW